MSLRDGEFFCLFIFVGMRGGRFFEGGVGRI